jgi:hypothetical protein
MAIKPHSSSNKGTEEKKMAWNIVKVQECARVKFQKEMNFVKLFRD